MDSFCSDLDEPTTRLSLSLVSYGSDVEELSACDGNESSTLEGNASFSLSENVNVAGFSVKEDKGTHHLSEDELLALVLERMGITGASKEKLNELVAVVSEMEAAQAKYLSAKLVLEAAQEVVTGASKLPPATTERVKQMMQRTELLDYVTSSATAVDPLQEHCGLLGLTTEHVDKAFPSKLPGSDVKLLKTAVENQLLKKLKTLQEMKHKTLDMVSKVLVRSPDVITHSPVSEHTMSLMSLQSELSHEIATNQQLMKQLDGLLGALVELRKTASYIHCDILSNIKSQINSLQSQLRTLHEQMVSRVYSEDKHVLEALDALKEHFDTTYEYVQSTLSKVKIKEAEYAKLAGTEFDNMVKKHLALKKSIEDRNYSITMLHSKST